MARSRPTSPSKAACASAQSGIALASFFNPDGDRVTSKARPPSERSATTHPEARSGFRARTKLVRSMSSMSANSVILSRSCTSSSPKIENCEFDNPAGAKWLSYRRLRRRALFRAAEGVTETGSAWCFHAADITVQLHSVKWMWSQWSRRGAGQWPSSFIQWWRKQE